jgi:hypothetical protein
MFVSAIVDVLDSASKPALSDFEWVRNDNLPNLVDKIPGTSAHRMMVMTVRKPLLF